ncbi:Imm21 family immunity protein [Actinomadura sp. K4S16]|uniref:Imm21 family immunity protein n=1 Tax=Actinomadura sp. K4S16 TaxID=1316147 RepID=UPI0011EC6AE5|nr:Imm21 family immunity protein [Actinomadura sp. K4S16]
MDWVESGGGPLLAAPASQLARWEGSTDDEGPVETWGDYGRACAVEGYIGLVGVGAGQGLVLGDEPATTTYLPDERLFVRWAAADSESELVDAARQAVHDVEWEEELGWDVDGPVVLFDSAWPGATPEPGNHLKIDLAPGPYRVRAAYTKDERTWMILVHLQPAS